MMTFKSCLNKKETKISGFAKFLLLWSLMAVVTHGLEPKCKHDILFMHGLGAKASSGSDLPAAFPERDVTLIELNEGIHSIKGLKHQRDTLVNYLKNYEKTKKRHYDLFCHSQGALLCRLAFAQFPSKYIRNLVLIAGPQMGVYGDSYGFKKEIVTTVSRLLRSAHTISVFDYWNDPKKKGNGVFFDSLKFNEKERENFLKVQNVVFLAGEVEDAIGKSDVNSGTGVEPWFSAILDTYDENLKRIPFTKSEQYKNDWLGLKTMMKEGRAHFITANVHHNLWLYEQYFEIIKPHMKDCEHEIKANLGRWAKSKIHTIQSNVH